jgi:hypothetical protein
VNRWRSDSLAALEVLLLQEFPMLAGIQNPATLILGDRDLLTK